MKRIKHSVQIARSIAAIFWLGFFMAISFMEAPLKFTAPSLSMTEGLQIGKIVFGMLNHCEWVILTVMIITCFIKKPGKNEGRLIMIAALILILETFWLLPALTKDANKIINRQIVTEHSLHWWYVALELIKAPILLFAGITGLNNLFESNPSPELHNQITVS